MATTYPRNGHAPTVPASTSVPVPQAPIDLAALERAYREATDAWIAASLQSSEAQERFKKERDSADAARYTEQAAENAMFQASKAWQQAQLDAARAANTPQPDTPADGNAA